MAPGSSSAYSEAPPAPAGLASMIPEPFHYPWQDILALSICSLHCTLPESLAITAALCCADKQTAGLETCLEDSEIKHKGLHTGWFFFFTWSELYLEPDHRRYTAVLTSQTAISHERRTDLSERHPRTTQQSVMWSCWVSARSSVTCGSVKGVLCWTALSSSSRRSSSDRLLPREEFMAAGEDSLFFCFPTPLVVSEELADGQEETPAQQQARMSASSATRELDELMASLSDFKVQSNIQSQGKSSPTGPQKPANKLDNMLGSLQSDLNRLGVQTVAKGVCGACKKPIVGQVVTAMGRTWHPEHFVCTHCQDEIGSRNFFERDGQPYCEKDYHNLFSPRCHYCNGPILDKVVTALDKTWHPEHFFCAQCGAFFGPEGFHEKDGKAFCRKDYFDMFAPKCGGCARAILENYISALNSLWHPECFVCRECFTPFINGSFFEHDGQPYCEGHYHERRGSLCSGCQKPITGRCITAMAKKFHPEHFVCAFCLKQLNKGTFKEQNDKPYCQGCFIKLFS
ncbi:hypothetical protein CRUP_002582 [Coryphaenoides rupestris]|nr:hypothetical protein CRUP_002582 [Coryphaenoides rupestris]